MSNELATWNTIKTGFTYHSFTTDGRALCKGSIRQPEIGTLMTEAQVDARLAEAWGQRVRGFSKCETCTTKEAAFRDRLEASMAPSTGEGDYLPPSCDVADVAASVEVDAPEAPADTVAIDATELRLLRAVVREARTLRNEWAADDLAAALDTLDRHTVTTPPRSWVLSRNNINAVDDALDEMGIYAKGYWVNDGTATLCDGLKIGDTSPMVARYGDTVTLNAKGAVTITKGS